MAGRIWFGTRNYMQWVKAPAINVNASKIGWESQSNYLSGGASIRRSVSAHKEFAMSWNLTNRDEIRAISDYADGIYGLGPVYWTDPFTADTNALPQAWATPFVGAHDGTILSGSETRPTLIQTVANSYGYPSQSAVYTIGTEAKPAVWIPIPPNYTAWVGATGVEGTGGKVVVTPTTGPATTGTPQNLTLLPVTDMVRVNASFDAAVCDGILVSLGGSGTVTLTSIIVQVLPTGSQPPLGGFISGQGHSGCTFASQPDLTQYSAVMDRVGLTVRLVETEQWL